MSDPGPSNAADADPVLDTEPSNSTPTETDKARGRKRMRTQVSVVHPDFVSQLLTPSSPPRQRLLLL